VAFSLFGALHRASSSGVLAPGRRLVRLDYERARDRREGGGSVHLGVEGACVAELELPHDLPFRWQIGGAGLHVGVDRGFPVCDEYDPPFPFTGTIDRVEIEIPHLAPQRDDAARSAADVAQALRHE
jgi:arylsulfatase